MAILRLAVVAPPWYEVPPAAYGGVERVCATLANSLVARGHDVTLIAAGRNHTRARFVRTLEEAPGEAEGVDPAIEVIHAARAADAIANLDVDLVHDHSLAGPLGTAARAAPTLVTAHMPLAGPESRLAYYEAIGRHVSLVALSDRQRQDAPHLAWVDVVHNGIDVTEFPFRERKSDYVLYLGRISPTKGVDLAIQAAREAGRRLVIAGKGSIPAETAYFQQHIASRLDAHTEWVGEVSGQRRLDLLADAHCLIFPVRWHEPFGLVLVEALACGTPVVALSEGAVPEIVEHDRTGIVCREPAELAAGIERCARLKPADCRHEALRRFDAGRMAERYEAVYHRVLDADG